MKRLRALMVRLTGLLGGARRERELADELNSHLQMHIDDQVRVGMSVAEARRNAILKFGGLETTRQAYRERGTVPFVETVVQDLHYAWRQFRRSPGFSIVAVLTLGAGIGATTAIYSLLDSILLRPLPFADQQRLVKVSGYYPKGWVRALQRDCHSLSSVLGYTLPLEHNVESPLGPERVFASTVTTNAFEVLGVYPAMGRFFLPEESVAGRDKVVVVSDGYWRQQLGGDAHAVGRVLRIDGESRTIIGVMPAGIDFPSATARLWLPVSFKPNDSVEAWTQFNGQMIGRMAPGVTPETVQAELRTLHPQLLRMFPWPMPDNWYADLTVLPLLDSIAGDTRPKLMMLLCAVALVLLIACANVANLLLARAAARTREIAVRGALGATAGRLVRQMLTESLLLGLLGGGVGVVFAECGLHGMKLLLPAETPRLTEIGLDGSSIAFVAGLAIMTSLLFGLVPALRLRKPDLQRGLHVNQAGGRARFRMPSILVIGQVALGVVVVIAAGLMLHSLWRLTHVDPGFRTNNLVTARVSLDSNACGDGDATGRCGNFYRDLLERAQGMAGVEGAALVSSLPMHGYDEGFPYDVEDHPRPPRQSPDQGSSRTVSSEYFQLLGIRLMHGRLLNDADRAGTSHAIVINQRMAERYWPGQNPLGKRIEWLGMERQQGALDGNAFAVVGVVSDTRHESFDTEAGSEMYTPMTPTLTGAEMSLVVESTETESTMSEEIRRLVASIDRSVPVSEVQALQVVVQDSARSQRSLTILLLAFALLALGVGMIGVYSLVAYMVNCRTREMGIRLALGATRAQLVRLVLRYGMMLAGVGCVLGVAVTAVVSRWLRSFLFATSPLDPAAFAAVPVLLIILTVVATLGPARRAARIQPVEALRAE
jgi:predicted permease